MTWDNATPAEIAGTTTVVFGLLATLWGLWDAVGDLRFLHANKLNGQRVLVARGNLRNEAVRAVMLLMFSGVGGLALVTPPGPEIVAEPREALLDALSGAGFMLAGTLLTFSSVVDRLDRRKLIRETEVALAEAALSDQMDTLNTSMQDVTAHLAEADLHDQMDTLSASVQDVAAHIAAAEQRAELAVTLAADHITRIDATGTDTNIRVKRVEDALAAGDATP